MLFAQLIQVDERPVCTLYGSVAAQDLGGAKAKQLLSACAPGEELTIKRDDQLRDFRRQAAGSPTVMPPSYGAQNRHRGTSRGGLGPRLSAAAQWIRLPDKKSGLRSQETMGGWLWWRRVGDPGSGRSSGQAADASASGQPPGKCSFNI